MKFDYSDVSCPWKDSYDGVPAALDYSEKTMSEAVLDTAEAEPGFPALTFMGKTVTYGEMARNIDLVARSLHALGIRAGNRVLVCLPNVPQAIYCLYGLNRIGAVAAMVHPLSAVGEIVYYLNEAGCDVAITLDQFLCQVQGGTQPASFQQAYNRKCLRRTAFPSLNRSETPD